MKLDQEKHPENWKEDKLEYGRFSATRRVPWPGGSAVEWTKLETERVFPVNTPQKIKSIEYDMNRELTGDEKETHHYWSSHVFSTWHLEDSPC